MKKSEEIKSAITELKKEAFEYNEKGKECYKAITNLLKASDSVFDCTSGITHTITDFEDTDERGVAQHAVIESIWYDNMLEKLVCKKMDGTQCSDFSIDDVLYLADEIRLYADVWVENAINKELEEKGKSNSIEKKGTYFNGLLETTKATIEKQIKEYFVINDCNTINFEDCNAVLAFGGWGGEEFASLKLEEGELCYYCYSNDTPYKREDLTADEVLAVLNLLEDVEKRENIVFSNE